MPAAPTDAAPSSDAPAPGPSPRRGRWQSAAFLALTALGDALGVLLAFFLAYYLPWLLRPLLGVADVPRESFTPSAAWLRGFAASAADWVEAPAPRGLGLVPLPWVLAYLVVSLHLTFQLFDLYNPRRLLRRGAITLPVLEAMALFLGLHVLGLWLIGKDNVSRLFLASYLVVPPVVIALMRQALERLRRALRRLGVADVHPALIVGTGRYARELAALIARRPDAGLRLAGFVPGAGERVPDDLPAPLMGAADALDDVLARTPAHELFLAQPELSCADLMRVVDAAHRRGLGVRVLSNALNVIVTRVAPRADVIAGIPLVDFGDGRFPWYRRTAKRALDLTGAALGLALLAPLVPLVALALRGEGPGLLFFAQTRLTEGRRPFTLWKFRSMRPDAEQQRAALAALNERGGAVFKVKRDPRVTRVGRLLRRFSIDELPQLWNVLRGEMSLVGPRPPLPAELAEYEGWHLGRFAGKGGITGLWQVSGRGTLDFDEMVVLDRYYLAQRRLFVDLRLLLSTVAAVLTGGGAA